MGDVVTIYRSEVPAAMLHWEFSPVLLCVAWLPFNNASASFDMLHEVMFWRVCSCRGVGGREGESNRDRANGKTETPASSQRALSLPAV